MNEPIRILLVDDSPIFIQAARDFLRYQALLTVVSVAMDAEEAIGQARKLKPEIILLDLNLARSSGLELIPVFKRDVPAPKIIVLTMMEESGYRAAALHAGADEFLPKNDMGRKLITVIHGLIPRSAPVPVDKQTEEALRIGVELYQSFLEDSSELICRFLPDGTLTYVNTAYCRYYGQSREELIGTNFIASAADDFPNKLREHFKSFTPDRPTSSFEQYDVLPDGTKRWREWVDRALFGPDGRVLEFQSTGRDITERKHMEEKLAEREAYLRTIVESEPECVKILDANGVLLDMNPAGLKMIEADSLEQVAGKSVLSIVAPEYRSQFRELNRRVFMGQSGTLIFEIVGLRGTHRWLETHAVPLFDSEGQVTSLLALARDITERKQAHEALKEKERLLSEAQRLANLGSWEFDALTGKLRYSEQMYRIYGISPETFSHDVDGFLALIHPDDRAIMFAWIQAIEAGFHPAELEFRVLLADGSVRYVRGQGEAYFDVVGNILRVTGTAQDVTERRQTEEAIRESQERYRAIFNGVRDAIFVETLSGQILDVNASACDMFGFRREEFLGKQVADLVPPGRPMIAPNDPAWQDFLDQPVETINLRANGEPFPVEISGRLQTIGGETRLLVVVRDITERKQRQRELEALVTVAAALRAAPTRGDMLPVIVDHTLSLLKAQGASLVMRLPKTGEMIVALARGVASHLTGLRLPPGQGISNLVMSTGQPYFNDDIHPDSLEIFPMPANAATAVVCVPLMAEGQATGALWALWVERRNAITPGELRLLMAIADIAGNALYRASIVETLEQRVVERTQELAQANERLQELDRLKSKFVSDVSHELRTPLTSLRLYTELLDHGKPEKQADYRKALTQQVDRLTQLVEDILNLSRLELGASKIQWEAVELNALIDAAVITHQPGAEAAGLQLSFTPGTDLPLARGVHNQLAQVVTNLIGNAINYTRQGAVQVRTFRRDERICLEVQDTGLGIDPEDVPHLFDRFYRGRQAVKSEIRGTGLGLAIVREIVDLHGGEIEVESTVHVGTTVRVWLPVMKP